MSKNTGDSYKWIGATIATVAIWTAVAVSAAFVGEETLIKLAGISCLGTFIVWFFL